MNSSKSIIKITLLLFIIVGFSSCSDKKKPSKDEILQAILKDSFKVKNEFQKIIVLNEGGCISCNKNYSKFLKSKINDDALFIIGATGSQFDIGYLDLINKNNIVYDYSNILEKKGFLANSGFILIENKKIDTIIALEAKNLEAQLTYIEKKLLTQ